MPWFPDAPISGEHLLRVLQDLPTGEHLLCVYDYTLGCTLPVHEGATYFRVGDKMLALVRERSD